MKYILLLLLTASLCQGQIARPPKDSKGLVVSTTLEDNVSLETIARFMNEHHFPIDKVDKKNKIITSLFKEFGLIYVQAIITVDKGLVIVTGLWSSTEKLTELSGEKFVKVPIQYKGQSVSYDKRAYAAIEGLAYGINHTIQSEKIFYLPAD
ncbi:hypothetical protein [Spirosoma flavum]|uniref:Beta-hexosaminidase bacterial type N-terminal domain-containing protein n=1 Tax=Spirosoma flavum TaxID=2048557 RepID=A0ABW6AJJ1_9BACT